MKVNDRFGTATIGFNEADFALALGVRPVAVRQFLGSFDYKTRPWAPDQGAPELVSSRLIRELEVAREGRVVTLAADGTEAGALGYNSYLLSLPPLAHRLGGVNQFPSPLWSAPA